MPAPADGAPVVVTTAVLRRDPPPQPGGEGHKGARGQVLVLGGSKSTPGAVLLAGVAALRAGAGVLQLATVESSAQALAVAAPEALVIGVGEAAGGSLDPGAMRDVQEMASSAQAVVLGPGAMSDGLDRIVAGMLEALGDDTTLVLDAKAIDAARPEAVRGLGGRAVVTPNFKEMADALGVEVDEVSRDPGAALRRGIELFGTTVALRGAESWVGGPGTDVYLDQAGTPGLGTSGSGDVLAGFLAGLVARGTPCLHAALWAVHVHGQAGQRLAARLGPVGFLARELLDELSPVMTELNSV